MEKETLQETANRLKRFPGKVRGEIFLNHADFIKEKEGKGGLKRLEEKMKELGAPLEFKKINSQEWMSEGISSLVVVTAKDIFYFEDKNIFEMGASAPRFSLGLKMLVKNVVLPQRLFEESPVYWKNLFDFGFVNPLSFDADLKEAVLQIHGFKTHPLLCIYHAGYIKGLAEFVLKSEKVTVEETKCVYKEDKCDEYKIRWD
jgi:hypothetical protein